MIQVVVEAYELLSLLTNAIDGVLDISRVRANHYEGNLVGLGDFKSVMIKGKPKRK
jgi:hypothetical protein